MVGSSDIVLLSSLESIPQVRAAVQHVFEPKGCSYLLPSTVEECTTQDYLLWWCSCILNMKVKKYNLQSTTFFVNQKCLY